MEENIMKGRLAAALSLSGVLVAGSAAALVNSQVLTGTPTEASSNTSSPDTSVAGSTPSTDSSVVVVNPPTTTVPSGGSTTTQATYQIGDAGLVTLDTAGDVLTIVSATPNAGWLVTEAESEDALNIEVKFQSATTQVEFHANLLFGVVSTSVEAMNLGDDSPDNSTDDSTDNSTDNSTSNTVDDDDDDRGGDDDDDDRGGDDDDDDRGGDDD
jgi:hypothetical protein